MFHPCKVLPALHRGWWCDDV